MAKVGSLLMRPWLLRTVWRDIRLASRLLREPHVPVWVKALFPLALLYVISPIDLLPDVIPGIGQLDDLALLYGALKLFLSLSPPSAVAFHHEQLQRRRAFSTMPPTDVVIDADYRREH